MKVIAKYLMTKKKVDTGDIINCYEKDDESLCAHILAMKSTPNYFIVSIINLKTEPKDDY